MKLNSEVFNYFLFEHSTEASRERYDDSKILNLDIEKQLISALVRGNKTYLVRIEYNSEEVGYTMCSCPYSHYGICKHVINVLVHADMILAGNTEAITFPYSNYQTNNKKQSENPLFFTKEKDGFFLKGKQLTKLTEQEINSITDKDSSKSRFGFFFVSEREIYTNSYTSVLRAHYGADIGFKVSINQNEEGIQLNCSCKNKKEKICSHLYQVFSSLNESEMGLMIFNSTFREKKLIETAERYGFSEQDNPEELFHLEFDGEEVQFFPKKKLYDLQEWPLKLKHLSNHDHLKKKGKQSKPDMQEFIMISEGHNHLDFVLMQASVYKNGGLKSSFTPCFLSQKIKEVKHQEELEFYNALISIEEHTEPSKQDIVSILKNPLKLPFYLDLRDWYNEKLNSKKLLPINVSPELLEVIIQVEQKKDFFHLQCLIEVPEKSIPFKGIDLGNQYFIYKNTLYYLGEENLMNLLNYFKSKSGVLKIPKIQYPYFKQEILIPLEQIIRMKYDYIKAASPDIVKKEKLDTIQKHLIYLSEFDNFVLITPTVAYPLKEIPVLSKRNMYYVDESGTSFEVKRNLEAETEFLRQIQDQHPSFEQIPHTEYFYLNKKEFLDGAWFLDAFEAWDEQSYTILGFNEIKGNLYNRNKMKMAFQVSSGIDWFDIEADVSFGDQKVKLKDLQKSVLNKKRFIELGDGSKGILPQEWLDKFAKYFRSGTVHENSIRTHKSHFQMIDVMFDNEVLTEEVQAELDHYKKKLKEFETIKNVKVPKKLKAKLRNYQKEGLNWLNFLDEFGFGGCLADDMGLGKTIQVIAYLQGQIEKGNKSPNLIVLPTSLLFNWQAELDKFAPSIKYQVLYGSNRNTAEIDFRKHQIYLTTYGTMLSDISILKEQEFNVIVLDESQAIKNPSSKRYKAARLLKGRQRLVLTGTPIENNTFDLYAQLSFAVPGLLGSAKRFSNDYAAPIDKFQDAQIAEELRQKIRPFLLRRTKEQVASDLPEKTEMVIHCEMGKEQRAVYDLYKSEFQKLILNIKDEEMGKSKLHILQGLTKLRQICNSPSLLSDQEDYGSESAKLDELFKQIDNLRERHKILIFSQFVGMLELIKERLDQEGVQHAYLTGQTKDRKEQVEKFQTDESVRIFLISLKAGGQGLNLTQAEYVFLVDPWWNPAAENQAIDRAHRIGQNNKVIAVRLITPDSIEEKIINLQSKKKKLAEDLIQVDEHILKKLTKDDLLQIL